MEKVLHLQLSYLMSKKKVKILLAEDDPHLGLLMVDYLEAENFEVKLCKDGEHALKIFFENTFDICLFDVMMPKIDGFTLAKEIRKKNLHIPIIFLTAKSMKADKLKGYSLGGDDYLTKPFDEEELLWKINAIVRRLSEKLISDNAVVEIGLYKFDQKNQALIFSKNIKRLTEKESSIIKYLSDYRNKIIKREEMLLELWGDNDYFLGRSLDVFITKIRKYLKEDPNLKIENIFGVGFIFNVNES